LRLRLAFACIGYGERLYVYVQLGYRHHMPS